MNKRKVFSKQSILLMLTTAGCLAWFGFVNHTQIVDWLNPFFSTLTGHDLAARSDIVQLLVVSILLAVLIALFCLVLMLFSPKNSLSTGEGIILLFLLTAAFSFFIYLSSLMQPVVDDFMNMTITREQSLFDKSISYYNEWSGRYLGPPVTYLYAVIPYHSLIRLFPILIIGLIFTGFSALAYLFFSSIAEIQKWTRLILSILPGSILCIGTLLITPSIYGSVYWFAGGAVYGLGLGLALCSLSAIFAALNDKNKKVWLIFALILSVLTCGTNELTSASICFIAFCVLVYHFVYQRAEKWKQTRLTLFLVTNLVCTAFSFAAPGNRARMTEHPEQIRTSLLEWVFEKMLGGMAECYKGFLQGISRHQTEFILLLVLLFLIGTIVPRRKSAIRLGLCSCAITGIASFVCFLTNATVMWAPDRSLITPSAWLLCACGSIVFCFGYLLCQDIEKPVYYGTLLFCSIAILLLSADYFTEDIEKVTQFSKESDYRESQLLQADKEALLVESCKVRLLFDELDDLREEPEFWVNQSMSDFFGLQALTAKDDCALFLENTAESTTDSR